MNQKGKWKQNEISMMWSFALGWAILQVYLSHDATGYKIKAFPKSCLDHLKSGIQENGYYTVADQDGGTLTVYCDFQSEPGSAWTLIMSWSLQNKHLPAFKSDPLSENVPVNEKSPNWAIYRLSKNALSFIKHQSSHWRATCSFNRVKFDYRDYVRGNLKDFDVITYLDEGQCKKIEYINIRGHVGYQTTVPFFQTKNLMLHTDSSYKTCGYGGAPGAVSSEDNFGYYYTINPKFRCTADPNATTQYWFGGYL